MTTRSALLDSPPVIRQPERLAALARQGWVDIVPPSLSRVLYAILLIAVLAACSSSPGTLTITEPRGGAVIDAETVEVQGTAPANTEIVHDIPALPDERTLSDADGQWRMTVDLDVGDNVLTFRLGDDPFDDTEQQVLVVRER